MFGTLFLVFQYHQRTSQNLAESLLTPFPSASGQVAAAKIEAASPSPWVVVVPFPSPAILKTTAPSPIAKSPNSSSSIDNFIYSNASINSKSPSAASLESSDSPSAITDWYKNKLNSLGFNATSFVMTNSNNNVLNKLVVAKNGQEVRVEIKKDASVNKTTINIELH